MTTIEKRVAALEQATAPAYATLAQAVNAARAQAGVVHDPEEAAAYLKSAGLRSAALLIASVELNRIRRSTP